MYLVTLVLYLLADLSNMNEDMKYDFYSYKQKAE